MPLMFVRHVSFPQCKCPVSRCDSVMTFDSPSSLYWFALCVPIVIFYILKIRLRRQPVSTVMFWKQVLDEQNPRSIWQRLRHIVSLLLQLAMLTLLVLALADPYFFWEVRSARRIVLVIDNSASMNATDVKPSRLAEARRQADQLIAGMRHRDEVALVAAGTQPQVIVGFTGRQRTLSNAVEAMSSSDGPSNMAEAIALGQRLLGERQDGKRQEVFVLTDGRFDGIEESFLDSSEYAKAGDATNSSEVGNCTRLNQARRRQRMRGNAEVSFRMLSASVPPTSESRNFKYVAA